MESKRNPRKFFNTYGLRKRGRTTTKEYERIVSEIGRRET
jgi:hypothetical protein